MPISPKFLQALKQRKALGLANRKPGRPPKWLPPDSVEREYRRALVAEVEKLNNAIVDAILPNLEKWTEQAYQFRPDSAEARLDRWTDEVEAALERASEEYDGRKVDARKLAYEIGKKVSDHNMGQLQKIISHEVGTPIQVQEPWLPDQLTNFADENARLIRNISEQHTKDISGIVRRGFAQGERHETIAEKIRKRTGVPKRRAQLIARDQVASLNGNLTEMRQREVGIEKYEWITSLDERVRPSHARKHGQTFSWDDPPSDTGHPGQDVNCRCTASPLRDEIAELLA